ncbi:MAG: DNA internalization-related competence protein ComEC/Rec2 [Burkholderiaceae bacterium]|nr:DNA internalization-related competence protein ComEC/Rec2 [Burkholderiaceae bacterium]
MRLPGSLLASVPLPAAVVVAAIAVHRMPALPPRGLAWALLAAGVCAALASALGRGALRWMAILAAAAGGTLVAADSAMSKRIDAAQEGRDFVVVGRVVSMPLLDERSTRFVFDIDDCPDASPDCPRGARIRLGWHAFDERSKPMRVQPGERWRFTVRLKRVHALHNPNAFDAELRSLEEGIAANGTVRGQRKGSIPNERLHGIEWSLPVAFERARMHLRAAMRAALADARPEAADVLVALVVGDQAAIGTRWWDAFNRTGIGHLMSISGLHITMLAGIAVAVARRLLHTRAAAASGLLLRWPARRLAWLIGVLVAFVYAGIAGWGIPAQRTCWMLAVAGVSLFTGRTRSISRVLALAAGVVTVFDPWAPLAAGFWLSFASVAAIAWCGAGGRARDSRGAPARGRRIAAALAEAIRTQWAASLALVPLGALFFASVSLVGPLANAFAIPLVSALVTPLAIGATALLPWLPAVGEPMLAVAATATAWLLDAIALLSDSPWAIAVVASPSATALVACVSAVVVLLAPVRIASRELAFAGLLPMLGASTHAPPAGALRVVALDVGQGSAVLVETGGRRLLYDAGPAWGGDSEAGARVILPYLRARGIDRVDAIVVSHLDSDHSGGLPSLLRGLRYDWVGGTLPAGHAARNAGRPFVDCVRGHAWRWDDVHFEVLHPGPEKPRGVRSPTNASSCVLRISAPAATVLLAGDLEAGQERALVERFGAEGVRADLLLAPHHGSNSSSSAAFLAAVAPRHAIVQNGYRNRFRHPADRVVDRYRAAGIELLRSDRDGAITIEYGRAEDPRIARSRIDDRRYWRVRLVDDLPVPPRAARHCSIEDCPARRRASEKSLSTTKTASSLE